MPAGLSCILLHGIPQDPRPLKQLEQLRQAVADNVDTFYAFQWARVIKAWRRRIAEGRFASEAIKSFDRFLKQEAKKDRYLVIIGYSAGGFIFYRWLLDFQPPEEEKDRIVLASMIAAPYHVREGSVRLNEVSLVVAERLLNEDEIRRIGESLPSRLRVFLGEKDTRIGEYNAIFPGGLDSTTLKQVRVPGADHTTICEHRMVLDQVSAWVRAIREALP